MTRCGESLRSAQLPVVQGPSAPGTRAWAWLKEAWKSDSSLEPHLIGIDINFFAQSSPVSPSP